MCAFFSFSTPHTQCISMSVVGSDQFYAPQKPAALRRPHIWEYPAHMSYKGITPPRNWRHQKYLKFIYGHDDALVAVWLMVKEFPAPRRPNMVPPSLDSSHSTVPSARWLKTEGWHLYWYVFTNHNPTPDLTSQKLKIWKIYSRTCL